MQRLIVGEEGVVVACREESEARLHHVTFRGVAKQIIFEDDDDRRFLGKRMREGLEKNNAELYAWCFMSNHAHLLLHMDLNTMASFMNGLLGSYSRYYNKRHERTGHLFQSRFSSVPIRDDAQLLAAVRYIHRNPEDIPGQTYQSFRWSSYREYLGTPLIANTQLVLSLFSDVDEFVRFHEEWHPDDKTPLLPLSRRCPLPDEEAASYACELLGIGSTIELASFEKEKRDAQLVILKNAGFTVKQLARLTGIGRNIIQRAR